VGEISGSITMATASGGSIVEWDCVSLEAAASGLVVSEPGESAESFGLHEQRVFPHFIRHLMEAIKAKNDTTMFTMMRTVWL